MDYIFPKLLFSFHIVVFTRLIPAHWTSWPDSGAKNNARENNKVGIRAIEFWQIEN